jgi:hypothetical protein
VKAQTLCADCFLIGRNPDRRVATCVGFPDVSGTQSTNLAPPTCDRRTILTPVAGADAALIWFGVMLGVNLQTSFMHPQFGFALFYLRGVAPREVKSSDILLGHAALGGAATYPCYFSEIVRTGARGPTKNSSPSAQEAA